MNSNKLDVYPHNFSEKIGYTEVRHILEGYCASTLGQEEMQRLEASCDTIEIARALDESREMITILSGESVLPSLALVDCSEVLRRIRPQGTYIEEEELLDLLRMLETLHSLQHFLLEEHVSGDRAQETFAYTYPPSFCRIPPPSPR